MGETAESRGLPDAAGRRAAGGVAARLAFVRRFISCRRGTTAVEYGLIVTLIFLAIVTAVTFFTSSANTMFSHINTAVSAAT